MAIQKSVFLPITTALGQLAFNNASETILCDNTNSSLWHTATEKSQMIQRDLLSSGETRWKVVSLAALQTWLPEVLSRDITPIQSQTPPDTNTLNLQYTEPIELTKAEAELRFIHEIAPGLKPKKLFISDIKWKFLVRSAIRGRNIMMTGDAGSGKTLAAKSLVSALDRPDFYFNLGSTQDPRATLIGNTQFNKQDGTWFAESAFVKAIKTPDAVILLDEITRAHPDAWNILMTVLDQGQRYLRLDEAPGSPIVEVHPTVCFVATANIGTEYTSTRVLDRAILDRFTIIEMDLLDADAELRLLTQFFPKVDSDDLKALAEVAHHTRITKASGDGRLSTAVSTRASVETASLLADGFDLIEAAEISIFPFFSGDGGLDSERTYVKQLIQKWIKPKTKRPLWRTPVGAESEAGAPTTDTGTDTPVSADTFDIQF